MSRYSFSSWRAIAAARRRTVSPSNERAAEVRAVADRRQSLHRDEPVVDRVGRVDDRSGIVTHPGEVSPQALDPGQLARGQQRLAPVAGAIEQLVRLSTSLIRLVELAHPPGEESREPELDDRPPGMVGGTLEQAVDGTQRLDRDRGIRLRAVVDQPLGARVHRLEHLEPALVVGGEEIDELGLELERLAVRLAPFGLAHRVQQHLDRLRIAPLSRAGEVQRRLGEVPGLEQRAGGLPVQQPALSGTRCLVDHVANERVLELIAELTASLLLVHDPRLDQLGQDRAHFLERLSSQRRQVAERNRPSHHRQQLEHALRTPGRAGAARR